MNNLDCPKITSLDQAEAPITTALLPIKGLRHNEAGEVTQDGVQIVEHGFKNLGISVDSEEGREALIEEMKKVLCVLNSQYEFLLKKLFETTEDVPKPIIDTLKEKNNQMRDVISVSRQILERSGKKGFIEGYANMPDNLNMAKNEMKAFEGFSDQLNSDSAALDSKNYTDLQRNFDISVQKNKSVSANLALYSFLNIVAAGLLFYIVSVE
jgi:hypothetical protein